MNGKKRLLVAGVGAAVAFVGVLAIPTTADAATKKPKRCMAQGSLSATADRQVDGVDAVATGARHVTKGSPCRDVNVRLPKGRHCAVIRVRWAGQGAPGKPVNEVGIAGLPADKPAQPVDAGPTTKWRDVCSGRWTVVAAGAREGSAYRIEVRGAAGEAVALKVRD